MSEVMSQENEPLSNQELLDVIQTDDLMVIEGVSPRYAKVISLVLDNTIDQATRENLNSILDLATRRKCMFSDLNIDSIRVVLTTKLFNESQEEDIRSFIDSLEEICDSTMEYKYKLQKQMYLELEHEDPDDLEYLAYKKKLSLRNYFSVDDDLVRLLMKLSDQHRSYTDFPIEGDSDLAAEGYAQAEKISNFFTTFLEKEEFDDGEDRVLAHKKVLELLGESHESEKNENMPLFALLTPEYSDKISPGFKKFLIERFDEVYSDKFFEPLEEGKEKTSGFEIDYQKDLEYLNSLDLSEEDYIDFLEVLTDNFIEEIKLGNSVDSQSTDLIVKEGNGVRGGLLDDPFRGGTYTHMESVEPDPSSSYISEIGVYLHKKLVLSIPGAWESLVKDHLYQSPSSIWSISPRKVIPFLKQNSEVMRDYMDDRMYNFLQEIPDDLAGNRRDATG